MRDFVPYDGQSNNGQSMRWTGHHGSIVAMDSQTIFNIYAGDYLAYVRRPGTIQSVFTLEVSKHNRTFEQLAQDPTYNVSDDFKDMKALPLYNSHPLNVAIHRDLHGKYRVQEWQETDNSLYKIRLGDDEGLYYFGVTGLVEDRDLE